MSDQKVELVGKVRSNAVTWFRLITTVFQR